MVNSQELDLKQWKKPEDANPEQCKDGIVDARGANWKMTKIGKLNLKKAKLCRCDLRGADLSLCDLNEADLRLAKYDSETKFPEGFDVYTSGAVGPGAKLNGAFLNGTDLREMDLRKSSLIGAYLSGSDLSGALLDGVSLAGADLRSAILRGAMCRETRFGTSELDMADFRGANLRGANLDNVESIRGADFTLCTGLDEQVQKLLSRSNYELDCWNPLTRSTTRTSLESLLNHTPHD